MASRKETSVDMTPWGKLLGKLSGVQKAPITQPYEIFMRQESTQIEPVVTERWLAQPKTKKDTTATPAFRLRVVRDLFSKLPEEKIYECTRLAKEESAQAKRDWAHPPPLGPEDKQIAIDTAELFWGPILQGIYERTGLVGTVIMGGPIPRHDGELRTVHVSYKDEVAGRAVPSLPDWDPTRFSAVSALMVEYLKTAFTEDDIRNASLPHDSELKDPPIEDDSSSGSSDSDSESDADTPSRPRKRVKQSVYADHGANSMSPTPSPSAARAPSPSRSLPPPSPSVAGPVRSFRCPRPGCSKSYKYSGGVQRHLKRCSATSAAVAAPGRTEAAEGSSRLTPAPQADIEYDVAYDSDSMVPPITALAWA
ncbi:hypothetical protein C8J57DRAFT_1461673 [Mycena rebaudengoi]|nr:hypothetical protein C8J57DRAFT_1461673 [Mycena rebaudengoi]